MNNKELVEYFVHHSPDFLRDMDLVHVDNKHSDIIAKAYEQIESDKDFHQSGFRNWKEQSDLSVPVQMSLSSIRVNGFINNSLKYLWTKLFRRWEDKFLLSTILDDIEVIRLIGAEDLLLDNPVHLSPGSNSIYKIHGTSVNLRWLRYIYLLKRIRDLNVLTDGGIWVDVGSYYGGLQGLVRKYYPESRIILVDFHHQLLRSFIYLSLLFPEANHILPDQLSGSTNVATIPKGSIMYVPVSNFQLLADQKVDLATNFFSLGEMQRNYFLDYVNSNLFKKSNTAYFVNRFVSAPFFEKTYDSDITLPDYLSGSRKIEYFDIFPMHHFLILKRKVLGRKFFRNVSSSYFEMVTSTETA